MRTLKALFVEDRADDADLLARRLKEIGYALDWTRVDTESGFLAALDTPLEIIFSDYTIPGFGGMRALELLRASGRDIPLILVSGTIGEELAVDAMRRGAADYLLKDQLVRLDSAVVRALNETRLARERRRTEEALRKSDQRLRSIIEQTMDCVMVLTPSGDVSEMNQAGLDMLEAGSLDELKERCFAACLVPRYRQAFDLAQARVLEGSSERLEFQVSGVRGGIRWMEMHAGPLADIEAGVEALICIMRDVTERKATEEHARAQLDELERWRAVTLGREDRVYSLKSEVNRLLVELGRSPCYSSADSDES